MCLKIYQLDPAKFLSVTGLPCQAVSKNTKVRLELLTDINMLLMVEKGIRGGKCNAIHWYAKDIYMKDFDKSKELSFLN